MDLKTHRRLKLAPRLLLNSIRCSLFLALSSAAFAAGQPEHYKNTHYRFELDYPSEFSVLDSNRPASPLLLRRHGQDFPSFNVVVETQTLKKTEFSVEKVGQMILSDYRRIGLTDATLVASDSANNGNALRFTYLLRYGSANLSFLSSVTIVPRANLLYTLTYIDRADDFESGKQTLQALLDSFVTTDPELPGDETPAGVNLFYSSFCLVAGLTFFIALALRMRRRKIPNL
jgi:hypothetical protein